MKIPLATSLRTRVGDTTKDARLKNAYAEVRGDQSVVRNRPSARGGVAVGTGTAQGGIGFNISGTEYFIGFWNDTLTSYTGGGTTWDAGTSYSIGDHVSYEFVDYWALTDNTGSQPPSSDWSDDYVPAVPSVISSYATFSPNVSGRIILSGGDLVATIPTAQLLGACLSASTGTYFKYDGKWYWEVTITTLNDPIQQYVDIGVTSGNMDSTRFVGYSVKGYSYGMIDQTGVAQKGHNNVLSAYGASLSQGDVVGVALDMDGGTVTFYKNGVTQGVAYSGLSGLFGAAIGGITSNIADIVLTANFGSTPFTYSVPSGYNSGLYI